MNDNWEINSKEYPPDRLNIQVTNICNANCTFCAYQYLEDEKGFINEDIFISAVDQYNNIGGKIINMTPLVGDLLVDRNIFKKLNYIKSKKSFNKIGFYTNGILLNKKDYAHQLFEARPTDVVFSLPGFEEKMYRRVYRSSAYKVMIKGVHKFLKLNKDHGSPIRASFALKPDKPRDEVVFTKDYYEYIEPYINENDLSFVELLDNWGGSIKQSDLTGNMTMAEKIPSDKKIFPCYFTFFLSVLINGDVRLCGCRFNNGTEYDGLVVGNLNNQSILDIWRGEKANAIRNNFLKKKLVSVCKSCTHYAPYSGKERTKFSIKQHMELNHEI